MKSIVSLPYEYRIKNLLKHRLRSALLFHENPLDNNPAHHFPSDLYQSRELSLIIQFQF